MAPDERAAYVTQDSSGNPGLGSAVRALLADADAASFLEAPAVEFAAPFLGELPHDLPVHSDAAASKSSV